ncbi:F-box/kelch-repeat protein SKIP25, partial [Cucurbita argyrosperma subsp. argyrosperma]
MVTAAAPTPKRSKLALHHHHHRHRPSPPLLPGLPDDVAQLCLCHLPPSLLFSVCRSWRRLLYSPSFPPFFSLYALLSSSPDSIDFFNFDPISSKWTSLPPHPNPPSLQLLIHHPSFLSRHLPVQSLAVSGHLLLLAATTHNLLPALPRPLLFSPLSNSWRFAPPLPTPRRWCAAGALRGSVYVASGIGSFFSTDVARSVERWDLKPIDGGAWEKVSGLKDGRFSRDATDAVGWRGKLCMVNVKGDARKEGLVYDLERDEWEEMSEGMIGGWRGPVATMEEEEMYVVDEVTGSLRRYDPERDFWEEVTESNRLKGAVQMAAGGGRVCVVCSGSRREIVVVDVVASPPRLWVEATPPGMEVVAVHVLPRMSASKS